MSFSEIPDSLRRPGVFVEISDAVLQAGIGVFPLRALIVGQRTSSGSVAAETLRPTPSETQAREEHGPGSLTHLMVRDWLAMNPGTELYVISLEDIVGTASQARVSFTGTIPDPGILYFYGAGKRLQVLCQTDLDTCASALIAAINADDDLPFTAAVGVPTSDVILTAKNSGTVANSIDLRVNHLAGESLPTGLTVSITPFGSEAAGAGDPDVSDVLDEIAGIHYDTVVHPYANAPANLLALETELAARADALAGIQGMAWSARVDTFANLASLGDGLNSKFSSITGMESFPGWDVVRGAAIAGEATRRLELDPVRPVTGRAKLPGFGPAEADKFTGAERNLLLNDGISTVRHDRANRTEIERLITTYQETSGGSPDDTFLDVQKLYGISFVRKSYVASFATTFPAVKIAEDGTPAQPDNSVVTPQIAKGHAVGWYAGLIREGICQDLDGFKDDSTFRVSATDPTRLEVFLALDFVHPLRVAAVMGQLRR